MKKTTMYIAAVLTVASIAAAPFVFAGPQDHFGGRGHGGFGPLGMLKHAKQELNLSDQQVADIKAIFETAKAQNAPYREQLRGGFHSIARTLIDNPNNLDGAQALLDQQTQAENALKSNMLTATSRALKVLTPEQRVKLSAKIAQRMEARRSRGDSR